MYHLTSTPPKGMLDLTLDWLRVHACGHENAKPIPSVISGLGFDMSKKHFQQTVLKKSRSNGLTWIGVSRGGIFNINGMADVLETVQFYTNRVQAESRNINILCAHYGLPFIGVVTP
jgi:hypothetical protein